MRKPLPIVSCSNCGACCLEQESPPLYLYAMLRPQDFEPDDADLLRVKALPDELRRELLAYGNIMKTGKSHPNGGICLWFDEGTRGCRHYDRRPSICREFELNSQECRDWRAKMLGIMGD